MNISQFEGLLRRTIAILENHSQYPAAQSVALFLIATLEPALHKGW